MVRLPGGGAGATTSLALAPASPKRSPRRMTGPVTVALGRSVAALAGETAPTSAVRARRMTNRIMRGFLARPASLHLAQRRHHLVGGLDHFRIHLIGALRRDEVGDLRDDVDIGGLEQALIERAEAGRAGIAGDRRARGGGLEEEVVAERLEAGFVGEIGELELAHRRGLRLAGDLRLH